ncbi:MAG: InlB B-repeat-containing protein, partial [Clostridia bacterium]|nr:InlB B-repeat-containing protein [Clostridia bacterium]
VDVTLTAEWEAIPPTITISTDTNSIVYGSEQATLTAVAVHDLPKTYQWYRSTTSGFTPSSDNAISGATATTYIHGETETNVGTYYYKCIVTANGLTATSNAVTITVTKAETYVTINSQQSLMYNGEDQVLLEVVINNATDDRQVYYAIDTDLTDSNYGTAGSTDLPTRKNAGKYNVSFYIPSNNNFNALQGSLLVEIAKLSNGVQLVEATDLVYDGTDHVLLQVTDRDETEDNVYYSIGTELKENGSTSLPTGKNAGTYKVYFYVPETTNYNSISGSATINIARAENMLVVKAKQDLLYTGSAQELIEVSNTENLEESVYFSIGTELDSTNYKANGTTTIPSATNVGTYSIYFYVPQSTNYDALGGGVEAVIEVKYTTLTVNPNGGTWGGTTNNSTFTEGNGTTKTIADATREGYSFTGWTFTGGGTWNDETNVFTFGASDAILMAVWDGLMYQVSYNGNGATSGQMGNSTHTYDVEQALSENQYSRTGYTFSGWATAANGTMAYEDKALVKNLATSGTFELFAVWTANTYEVS